MALRKSVSLHSTKSVVFVMLNSRVYWEVDTQFSGAFVKMRKTTFTFIMSVRMKQLRSHWTDFDET
jgi:hypothetical protein